MTYRVCAVNHTIEGDPCRRPATAELFGEPVCGRHTLRFGEEEHEYGAYLEKVVFRIEAWLRGANGEGDAEAVRDLRDARAKAALELDMARVDREMVNEDARLAAHGAHALFDALKRHNRPAGERCEEVAALAVAVAWEMDLSTGRVSEVEQATLIRDVGKIKIPAAVLEKPGPLDEDERRMIREHPVTGASLVAQIEGMAHLAPIIRAQEERWDGWGRPDGLQGEEIPLASRIICACAAYHAMTSGRPYRQTISREAAMEKLENNAGTQFCPSAVEALLKVLSRASEREDAPAEDRSSR